MQNSDQEVEVTFMKNPEHEIEILNYESDPEVNKFYNDFSNDLKKEINRIKVKFYFVSMMIIVNICGIIYSFYTSDIYIGICNICALFAFSMSISIDLENYKRCKTNLQQLEVYRLMKDFTNSKNML